MTCIIVIIDGYTAALLCMAIMFDTTLVCMDRITNAILEGGRLLSPISPTRPVLLLLLPTFFFSPHSSSNISVSSSVQCRAATARS